MPEAARRIRFVADRGDARLRLDQILVRRIADVSRMSRTRAQEWIDAGAVLVDGHRARRAAVHVREGAVVEIALPADAEPRARPHAQDLALDVLYEDEYLLAINKPAGVVVHPSYKNVSGTVLNAVLWKLRDRSDVRPGIVSRLDKQTSGVMLVALAPEVHSRVQREAAAGRIRKEYLAVVRGEPKPPCGEIDLPLGRDEHDRRRVVVVPTGAASVTRYEVLGTDGEISVVRCDLVTGRTHQIRVHLAARGWPMLGDEMYGVADVRVPRQALHAWRIRLPHPRSRDMLTITAPPPNDLEAVLAVANRRRS